MGRLHLVGEIYREVLLALQEDAPLFSGLGLRGTVEAVFNDFGCLLWILLRQSQIDQKQYFPLLLNTGCESVWSLSLLRHISYPSDECIWLVV